MTRPTTSDIDPSRIAPGLRFKAAAALASLALLVAACGGGSDEPKPAAVQDTTPPAVIEVVSGAATSTSTPQLLAAVPPPIEQAPPVAALALPAPAPRPALNALNDIQTLRYTLSIDATGSLLGDIPNEVRQTFRNVSGSFVSPDRTRLTGTFQGLPVELIIIGNEAWIRALGVTQYLDNLGADIPTVQNIWDEGLAESLQSFACGSDYETVNGLAARHCTIGLNEFSQLGTDFGIILPSDVVTSLNEFALDVWISDEGYPMRLRMAAAGYDPGGRDFRVNLSFNIREINGAVSIPRP